MADRSNLIFDHLTRTVRFDNLEAFRLMKPGTLYSDLPEDLRCYRADIFNDKYNRFVWENLFRSITAHIAKDGYWYIRPDHKALNSLGAPLGGAQGSVMRSSLRKRGLLIEGSRDSLLIYARVMLSEADLVIKHHRSHVCLHQLSERWSRDD